MPMTRACGIALLLALWPALAVAAPAMPPGRPAGGLGISQDAIDVLRREGDEARSRVSRRELEQVLVTPQRPGRNNVRYYDFEWRRYDYLDHDGQGGVRFYYYEREVEIARIAAAVVRDHYEELARRFDYRPTTRVPYILYNSHREFQNTNAFFVSEGVLGVTSPQDLRMALPYWGEFELFREVSTHEMVHQFTIQKVADRAAAQGIESPVMRMPLWFIEGLAEYYSKDGIDLETDMFARDLLLNPRPERGYMLIGFWDDYPGSFVYTYKLGQLRVAFLAEAYGEQLLQAVLDQSPQLASANPGGQPQEPFEKLVARISGETSDTIAQRFSAWMKRRYLPAYLVVRQEPPAIAPVTLSGEPDAFSSSADGRLILYRTVERDSGRSRLYLADRSEPKSAALVAADGVPGMESLHPVLRRVTAVGDKQVAFFARHDKSDALYVVDYAREEHGGQVRMRLGQRRRIDLHRHDLIEAGDPAFSPKGDKLAFFALDGVGRIDVWVAELATGELRRVTNDVFSERDLAWSDEPPEAWGLPALDSPHQGTLLLASDHTAHRRYNLFAMDPRTGERMRLTDEPADHRHPFPEGAGRVVFSTDARGKLDLHRYDREANSLTRMTDFVTGLAQPAPGPNGLQAIGFLGGQFRVFDVPPKEQLDLDVRPARPPESDGAPPLPDEPLPDDSHAYEPYAWRNWRLENGVAAVGSATMGQGALLFGDVLSDRNALLQVAVMGDFQLTDALAFYVDRSRRQVWGAGAFHTFNQRTEPDAPGFDEDVIYLQREYGVTALWSYPLDTFLRVEARGVVQGLARSFETQLDHFGLNGTSTRALREWQQARGGFDLETLASVRLGYDTTRYKFPGGAAGGSSVLVELGGGYLPLRSALHTWGTLDAQTHFGLLGISTLHLRMASGLSAGSVFGRQFYLSAYDNMRGLQVNDRRLLGSTFAVFNADLEIPLDRLVRLAIFSNVEGVVGLDVGGVANHVQDLWASRTMAAVLGTNLGLGPFELRLHFAYPIDIGGLELSEGWVPNVSLRYAYF